MNSKKDFLFIFFFKGSLGSKSSFFFFFLKKTIATRKLAENYSIIPLKGILMRT